jgi:hypothetical protein
MRRRRKEANHPLIIIALGKRRRTENVEKSVERSVVGHHMEVDTSPYGREGILCNKIIINVQTMSAFSILTGEETP